MLPESFRRATTEEFALDSFQNLMYSVARFHEVRVRLLTMYSLDREANSHDHIKVTGRYPTKITVVGFGVKERRFVELHRRALRFPRSAFFYHGIDSKGDLTKFLGGEVCGTFPPLFDSGTTCTDPPVFLFRPSTVTPHSNKIFTDAIRSCYARSSSATKGTPGGQATLRARLR